MPVALCVQELDTLCSNHANYSCVLSVIGANMARAVMLKHLSNRMQRETPAFSSRVRAVLLSLFEHCVWNS